MTSAAVVEQAPRVVYEDRLRSWRSKAVFVLLLLQVYDLWITFRVLDLGGTEMNLVARFLIGLVIVVPIIIPLKVGIGFWAWYRSTNEPDRPGRWNNLSELPALCAAFFTLGIYALVAVLNTVTYFQYA